MVPERLILVCTIGLFLLGCTSLSEKQTDNTPTNVPMPEKENIEDISPPLEPVSEDSTQYLFPVEGYYTLEPNDADCKMELQIYRANKQFSYELITNTKQWHGNIEISFNEKHDGYYINLKGIEWSEYGGEATPDDTEVPAPEDVELPQEVEAMLYENEITIQNTGNAMNYYVKFGDCDLKYIHLLKKKKKQ